MIIALYFAAVAAEPAESPEYAAARSAILAELKDPDSAKFGSFSHGAGDTICGSVNSKNSYGGYVGMAPFAYTPSNGRQPIIVYESTGNALQRTGTAELLHERGCKLTGEAAIALQAWQELNPQK